MIVLRRKDDKCQGQGIDLIKCFLIEYDSYSRAVKLIEAYLGRETGSHRINSNMKLTVKKKSFTIQWSFDSESHLDSKTSSPNFSYRQTNLSSY